MNDIPLHKKLLLMRFPKPQLFNDTSTIIWEINPQKRGKDVFITIAKALDPTNKSRPKKGQAKYNYDAAAKFILGPLECYELIDAVPKLLKGIYENPKESNPKYKKIFQIVHFRRNTEDGKQSPSRLLLQSVEDKQGNPTSALKLTIVPPKDWKNSQSASYVFKPNEFRYFLNFLETYTRYFDLMIMAFEWIRNNYYNLLFSKDNINNENKQENIVESSPKIVENKTDSDEDVFNFFNFDESENKTSSQSNDDYSDVDGIFDVEEFPF